MILVVCFSDNWTIFLSLLDNDNEEKQPNYFMQNIISNRFFPLTAPAA